MSAFCSGLLNEISRCCYDFYHAPFTKKNLIIAGGVLVGLIIIIIIIVCTAGGSAKTKTGRDLLEEHPLVDGANSLSYNIKNLYMDQVNEMKSKLNTNLSSYFSNLKCDSCQTDFVRLKNGLVSTQIFSVSTDCGAQFKDAVSQTLEQIDLLRRLAATETYKLFLVKQSEDITKKFKSGKIGGIINVWGGHNIDSRLAVLRMYYDLGVRVMSLVASSGTNACYPPWANNATGLSDFGKKVVGEMNRLGMIIDLTGSPAVIQTQVLNSTTAPVIFSHSGSDTLQPNALNIDDHVLEKYGNSTALGLVMVPFTPEQLTGDNNSTMDTVANHLRTMMNYIPVTKLGIGSNFDNMTKTTKNLEDVSKFPALFNHLLLMAPGKSGPRWTESTLKQLAGQNFINVFKAVEKESKKSNSLPDDSIVPETAYGKETTCYSDFLIRYKANPPAVTTEPPTQPTKPTPKTNVTKIR